MNIICEELAKKIRPDDNPYVWLLDEWISYGQDKQYEEISKLFAKSALHERSISLMIRDNVDGLMKIRMKLMPIERYRKEIFNKYCCFELCGSGLFSVKTGSYVDDCLDWLKAVNNQVVGVNQVVLVKIDDRDRYTTSHDGECMKINLFGCEDSGRRLEMTRDVEYHFRLGDSSEIYDIKTMMTGVGNSELYRIMERFLVDLAVRIGYKRALCGETFSYVKLGG